MVASTKVANCLALGGGTLIFIVVAAITVYMTSEYNKGPIFLYSRLTHPTQIVSSESS